MPRLPLWLLAALAGLATLYHPVLGWGPVAEDFQFALKRARARESPGERRSLSICNEKLQMGNRRLRARVFTS